MDRYCMEKQAWTDHVGDAKIYDDEVHIYKADEVADLAKRVLEYWINDVQGGDPHTVQKLRLIAELEQIAKEGE